MNSVKKIYKFLSPHYQTLFLEYPVKFEARFGQGKPPHEMLYNLINEYRNDYSALLKEFLNYKDIFSSIKVCDEETNNINPCWNNGFLPGLDIVALYSLINKFKPKHYVEIGSGYSTKVAYKAIKDNSLSTKITSLDPYPRAEIDQISDEIIRKPLEKSDFEFIFDLKPNDILFIDNSHRILPNSDATVFFTEILPKIPKGVIVHIHDIYLPYDYPQFMCNRFYSEQYMLAAYLLANIDKYKPILPNYFISKDSELKEILKPIWEKLEHKKIETHGGSFWLLIN